MAEYPLKVEEAAILKLTDNELDDILAKGGLSLAQPYSPRGSYRKDGYLLTKCNRCGVEAHYRLKYILDKNGIGEKVCRACYWLGWYDEGHNLEHMAIGKFIKAGHTLDELIDHGVITAGQSIRWQEAEALADKHGYELLDLIHGGRRGDDVMLVKCRACGRQTAERPCDVEYGCTCGGIKTNGGVAFGNEVIKVPRESHPVASNLLQDGSPRLLKEADAGLLAWWDEEENSGPIPEELTQNSRQEFAWKCPTCGHKFHAPVFSMARNHRCPLCTAVHGYLFDIKWAALKTMVVANFPDLLAAWNDDADPFATPVTTSRLFHLTCPKGHHPTQTAYSYLTNGCMVCRGLATKALNDRPCLAVTDPELAAEWLRAKGGERYTPENVRDGSKRTVTWRCIACGHEWDATVRDRQLRMNNRCPECGKVMGSLAWKYPELAAEWSPSNPVSPWNTKPFGKLSFTPEWICGNDPSHVWRMSTSARINGGKGCPFCKERSEEHGR